MQLLIYLIAFPMLQTRNSRVLELGAARNPKIFQHRHGPFLEYPATSRSKDQAGYKPSMIGKVFSRSQLLEEDVFAYGCHDLDLSHIGFLSDYLIFPIQVPSSQPTYRSNPRIVPIHAPPPYEKPHENPPSILSYSAPSVDHRNHIYSK
jgi:hypothetical protein